ncbi:MAG: TRAM domain-containing protein, partial [Acidobacteria bacterium]|nr:TRAM domain-containing protein [Acidobacteriota bacterium]
MPQAPRISSNQLSVGDRIEVTIQKIVPKGVGLAFVDRQAVFVPLTAPGDLVRAKVVRTKGNVTFAEIEEILSPGPDRIAPPCEYFGRCGGCDFQQLDYPAQLTAKIDIIRDCLSRIGKIDFPHEIPIIASTHELNYRLRVQWHLDARTKEIGYFARETHDVIDVTHCPIASSELNAELQNVRENVEWEKIWSNRIELDVANGSDGRVSKFSPD